MEYMTYDEENVGNRNQSCSQDETHFDTLRDKFNIAFSCRVGTKDGHNQGLTQGRSLPSEPVMCHARSCMSFRSAADGQLAELAPLLSPQRPLATIPRRSGMPRTGSYDNLTSRSRQIDCKSHTLVSLDSERGCVSSPCNAESPASPDAGSLVGFESTSVERAARRHGSHRFIRQLATEAAG